MALQSPIHRQLELDPKTVASIILGGGAGTRLFPLTQRRAKPAVPIGGCYRLVDIPMSISGNSNPGESGKKWFQGTADAVRQFLWLFEEAEHRNIENVLILCGDQLYRMDYMNFLQKHISSNADISISCLPVDDSRAADFGLVKGEQLRSMRLDTTVLGLSAQEASKFPYIASMGIYLFKTDVLLNLLRRHYPNANDFGSEVIPMATKDFNVQAYLFNGYWEDIGTIKSFFDANMALMDQPPKFQLYDQSKPIFSRPRFLPPTKLEKCLVMNSLISDGCF
ncbi:hypothetical protein K1719_036970 [Acacia pycnantha]|nr:hypothetical protein K1719_036970 [Acacia pycnantha]